VVGGIYLLATGLYFGKRQDCRRTFIRKIFRNIFLTTKPWKKNIHHAQIDRELEILKIEKEISYQKLFWAIGQKKV
jgi:hypothetical protein